MKQYTIARRAASWYAWDLQKMIDAPEMYYQAHEGEGYLRLTNDIKQAKVMSSIQIADEVLNLCKRSRGMFHYDIVTIS